MYDVDQIQNNINDLCVSSTCLFDKGQLSFEFGTINLDDNYIVFGL